MCIRDRLYVFKEQVPVFLEAAVVVIPLAEAGPEIEVPTPIVAVANSKLLPTSTATAVAAAAAAVSFRQGSPSSF